VHCKAAIATCEGLDVTRSYARAGAYDDYDGAYRIVIGVNQVLVPEPQT
jgi:hypothetical protein